MDKRRPSIKRFIQARKRSLSRRQKSLEGKWRQAARRLRKLRYLAMQRLPILNDVVFFESFHGASYSGNPKAICEKILSGRHPLRCVWSLEDMSTAVPPGVKKVKTMSWEWYWHHARARVLVHNTEFKENLPLRAEQTYINTQHGTPLKLMGSDMVERLPEFKGQAKRWNYMPKNGRWSYLVSPNQHTTEVFRRVFQFDGPVLEVGYPRNDIFFHKNGPQDISALKQKLNIPEGKQVILYAPTWRNQGTSRQDNAFKLRIGLDTLQKRFGETHVVILRLHHLMAGDARAEVAGYGERMSNFAFDRSGADCDIQELMLVSDLLVTDYSSVMFDYSVLRRPIVFFAYDLDEYSGATRGMYFDLEKMAPGPVVRDVEELVAAISDVAGWQPKFSERQKLFHEKFCAWDKGDAAQAVLEQAILPRVRP